MNKMNRKLEYSLMALLVMITKKDDELTSAKEVCQKTGSPFDATSRVMQILSNHGVLKSVQGAQGGYKLIQNLEELSIYDLMEKLLGPLGLVKCINGEGECELLEMCNIKSPLVELNKRLVHFYQTISVSELLEANKTPDQSIVVPSPIAPQI